MKKEIEITIPLRVFLQMRDALVRIASRELPQDYGYTGCRCSKIAAAGLDGVDETNDPPSNHES